MVLTRMGQLQEKHRRGRGVLALGAGGNDAGCFRVSLLCLLCLPAEVSFGPAWVLASRPL